MATYTPTPDQIEVFSFEVFMQTIRPKCIRCMMSLGDYSDTILTLIQRMDLDKTNTDAEILRLVSLATDQFAKDIGIHRCDTSHRPCDLQSFFRMIHNPCIVRTVNLTYREKIERALRTYAYQRYSDLFVNVNM